MGEIKGSYKQWDSLRHFKREEFVKDPDRMAWSCVYLLDDMRNEAGVPFHVNVGWDNGGHVAESSHYQGYAVDGYFSDWSLLDQWLFAERFPWAGIGLYPYWHNPGLHLDTRLYGKDHPNLGKRWWRDSAGVYQPINRDLLKILMEP